MYRTREVLIRERKPIDPALQCLLDEQAANSGNSPHDSNVSPLQLQEVPALPPTLVATAEYDMLRDEEIAYAEKLSMAGIAVTHLHAPDMNHNFVAFPGTVRRFPQADATLTQIAQWLQAVLRSTP